MASPIAALHPCDLESLSPDVVIFSRRIFVVGDVICVTGPIEDTKLVGDVLHLFGSRREWRVIRAGTYWSAEIEPLYKKAESDQRVAPHGFE